MPTSYIDFEISFQRRDGDTFPFVAVSGTGGEVSSSVPDITADPTYQQLLDRLAKGDTNEAMLNEFGTLLFNALFRDDVRQRFSYTQGSQNGRGIRLKIKNFPGETTIASVPWEFLYDPDRQNPFVLLDISLVRYPQAAVGIPNVEAKLPLRVLLTAAQPQGLQETYADEELDTILASLNEYGLIQNGQIEIVEERHLTRMKLQRLLRQNFHVWHFAGHGDFLDQKQTGVLLLEDRTGDSDRVQANELATLLSTSGIRLVILDACKSGRVAAEPFRSIAPQLTANNVPAVIAMQFTVPTESTVAFAGEFYAALAEGLPIDACVTEGRKAVSFAAGRRNPDWGTPVVYTRASDGILFHLPEKPPVKVEQPKASVVNDFSNANIQGGVNITTGGTNISGNTINSGGASTDPNDTELERETLRQRINSTKRRLFEFQKQQAIYGIGADPSIVIQIEDLQKQISKMEQELAKL